MGLISINNNVSDVVRRISRLSKQADFAFVKALTRTAFAVDEHLKLEMRQVFDRPTPYTLNSNKVKPATLARPTATVFVKDKSYSGKGYGADDYLFAEVHGGQRRTKAFEKALQSHGWMPAGTFAMPAAGARLDAFGNMSRGQMVQILSQLKIQRTGGYESRASNSAASKRTRRRQGVTYFAVKQTRGKLKAGIYYRKDFAQGSAIKPVVIFVGKASYQVRFKYDEVAAYWAKRNFEPFYKEAMDHALRTARL